MLSALRTLTRSTTNPVASCSYTRNLYSRPGHNGLRGRNWQTPAAYPAPKPLMSNDTSDDNEHIDLSEEEEFTPPRKLQTRLKDVGRHLPEEWKRHRAGLQESFPDGWLPPKKLSREAMNGLRMLHAYDSDVFTTPVLASKFRISPEAVRRILKSKWEPTRERRQKLAERERMNIRERLRRARLEEAKSRIEAIAAKKKADKEENELYWSKQDPEKRLEVERSQRWNKQGARTRGQQSGGGRPQHEEEKSRPWARLFFS